MQCTTRTPHLACFTVYSRRCEGAKTSKDNSKGLQYVISHPRRESSPNTAAPSTIHWASVVRGSFFCIGTHWWNKRVYSWKPQFDLRVDLLRVIWPISYLHQCPAVPADRRLASYVCCERPASPDPIASPPDYKTNNSEKTAYTQTFTV